MRLYVECVCKGNCCLLITYQVQESENSQKLEDIETEEIIVRNGVYTYTYVCIRTYVCVYVYIS